MERAMMMNKEDKLRQSYHTPFYQRPLTSEFGYKGTTQAAATVLAGVYDTNHHLDPHVRDMLNHLQMPKSIQELGKLLEDYQRYWRKANENISCTPGPLSFSMMKAEASSNVIAQIDCLLIRIPLNSGKNFIDVMIQKKGGIHLPWGA